MTPRVLDLFSGIGGFALAFEAAGFETLAFAEIEPYPCKILAQHWPNIPNLGDVKGINGEDYRGAVEVVCGGFPCQDISAAGKGAGLEGERSGLWFEMLRIIAGVRPAFCLIENVPALRTRGADRVLADLEESGYTGRPFVVGAVHAGAPHRRQRVWIMAYSSGERRKQITGCSHGYEGANEGGAEIQAYKPSGDGKRDRFGDVADSSGGGIRRGWEGPHAEPLHGGEDVAYGNGQGLEIREPRESRGFPPFVRAGWWATEPALGRVAHGVPHRAHRIKALGNSIVPAVAYPFARWIKMTLDGVGPGEKPPEGTGEAGSQG